MIAIDTCTDLQLLKLREGLRQVLLRDCSQIQERQLLQGGTGVHNAQQL